MFVYISKELSVLLQEPFAKIVHLDTTVPIQRKLSTSCVAMNCNAAVKNEQFYDCTVLYIEKFPNLLS